MGDGDATYHMKQWTKKKTEIESVQWLCILIFNKTVKWKKGRNLYIRNIQFIIYIEKIKY
jgi:hypothetical protein